MGRTKERKIFGEGRQSCSLLSSLSLSLFILLAILYFLSRHSTPCIVMTYLRDVFFFLSLSFSSHPISFSLEYRNLEVGIKWCWWFLEPEQEKEKPEGEELPKNVSPEDTVQHCFICWCFFLFLSAFFHESVWYSFNTLLLRILYSYRP